MLPSERRPTFPDPLGFAESAQSASLYQPVTDRPSHPALRGGPRCSVLLGDLQPVYGGRFPAYGVGFVANKCSNQAWQPQLAVPIFDGRALPEHYYSRANSGQNRPERQTPARVRVSWEVTYGGNMPLLFGILLGLAIGHWIWGGETGGLTYDDGVNDGWADTCNQIGRYDSRIESRLKGARIC